MKQIQINRLVCIAVALAAATIAIHAVTCVKEKYYTPWPWADVSKCGASCTVTIKDPGFCTCVSGVQYGWCDQLDSEGHSCTQPATATTYAGTCDYYGGRWTCDMSETIVDPPHASTEFECCVSGYDAEICREH